MPKGSDGQSRHRDATGNALPVTRTATGEIEDSELKQSAKHGSGLSASKACFESRTDADRREISRLAAEVRRRK